MENNNYLLGNGERLTSIIKLPRNSGDKNPPYDLASSKERLGECLLKATSYFDNLSSEACPNDLVTIAITMHPRYISKSEYPGELLKAVGLKSVGGRSRKVIPASWGIKVHPNDAITDEILAMGSRHDINKWSKEIFRWTNMRKEAEHLKHIEQIQAFDTSNKLKYVRKQSEQLVLLEVILHDATEVILHSFKQYIKKIDGEIVQNKIRKINGLYFVPVYVDVDNLDYVAEFSFIRVVRKMPSMRSLESDFSKYMGGFQAEILPSLSDKSEIKVAVFDGGLPDASQISDVNYYEADELGEPTKECLEHGLATTSALLYGPLKPKEASRAICKIDHIRVIGKEDNGNDFYYYNVLDRILGFLDTRRDYYDFVNFSLGPDISIEDVL